MLPTRFPIGWDLDACANQQKSVSVFGCWTEYEKRTKRAGFCSAVGKPTFSGFLFCLKGLGRVLEVRFVDSEKGH